VTTGPQSGLFRRTLGGVRQVAGWVASLLPDCDQRLVWQEFRNKARAFDLFANVESGLQLQSGRSYSAGDLIEKLQPMDPYESPWIIEGVGHFLADRHREASQPLFGSGELPVRWLVPLHVGMGLSFANRVLRGLPSQPAEPRVQEAVESFVGLCRGNAQPGFECVAHEALGLVTRNLYPRLVRPVALAAAEIGPEIEEYFWHGVGRGLYFLPANAMPSSCAPWIAIDAAQKESPHPAARRNTLAGLAWALILVNLQYPEIPALFLKHHSGVLCQHNIFRNGITSAMRIWIASSPEDPSPKCLIGYQPDRSDGDLCRLWAEQVVQPCEKLIRTGSPAPDERTHLPQVFRYVAWDQRQS
jgi:hypothetical protein